MKDTVKRIIKRMSKPENAIWMYLHMASFTLIFVIVMFLIDFVGKV